MRYADTLNIYSKLREGFEEKEAKVIAVAIESALEEADEVLLKEVVTKKDIVQMATKEDITNTKEDITNLRIELKEDISNLRTELKQDMMLLEAKIGVLEAKLKQEVTTLEANMKAYIANFKSEIIKWMFLFWIGQVAVVFGIVKFVK